MREREQDRRVQRTHQLLHTALISLISEKGYEAITVQDIIDRANVGRSTFYAHYLDKDDLLFKGFEGLLKALETQPRDLSSEPPTSDIAIVSLGLFRHIQEQHNLSKAMIGKRSGDLVLKQVQQYLINLMQQLLKARSLEARNTGVPLEILTYYVATTLLNLMVWWLDNDFPYSAEQINEIYLNLIKANLP